MAWSTLNEPADKRKVRDSKIRQNMSPPPPCSLLFLDSARNIPEGTEERLTAANITLGRGKDCLICYGDEFPMVSRMHASIEWNNNNFYLRHLSATNQTLLNGRPISRKWFLENGDVIQLAPSGPKIKFGSAVGPLLDTVPVKEKKGIDIYTVGLVLVVAISLALIGWVAYLMMFES